MLFDPHKCLGFTCRLLTLLACALLAFSLFLFEACSSKTSPADKSIFSPALKNALATRSAIPSPDVQACAACHPAEFESWMKSQHAVANRLVDAEVDAAHFQLEQSVANSALRTSTAWTEEQFSIVETDSNDVAATYEPVAVIGVEPLIQYLVPTEGGRLQTANVSYDTRSNEWFNSQETEYEPEAWQHWRNRGMTWNSQCAFCHMTGFEKNYDPATDSYDSSWQAMGINCVQCHGDVDAHMKDMSVLPTSSGLSSNQLQSACASCHARREELTGSFKLGDEFNDHYRLHLPDAIGAYYADGQVIEENFTYGSFMMSRMGHKGITCLDCHDPHSGGLVLPAVNNMLCMTCHAPPTRREAKPIIPTDHSHHPIGSTGNRCIECHMPVTKFMVRDPRRDHGFTSPDPVLTKELGIPNACNSCHGDQSIDWAIEWATRWYGEDMNERARTRARILTLVQEGDRSLGPELLDLAKTEEIAAWNAALTGILAVHAEREDVRAFLEEQLEHADPAVRAAAIRGLGPLPDYAERIKKLRADPVRLVRLDAGWATWPVPPSDPAVREEIFKYFENISDQPAGALRKAQLAVAEGRIEEAVTWARKAVEWDDFHFHNMMLGRTLNLAGKNREARQAFEHAMELEPENAEYPYLLALLLAETKKPREALLALQKVINLDPAFGRAWYNLGLAYAELERLDEAITALNRSETLMEGSPEPAFARATIYLRLNQQDKALESAKRALVISPGYQPAQRLVKEFLN